MDLETELASLNFLLDPKWQMLASITIKKKKPQMFSSS